MFPQRSNYPNNDAGYQKYIDELRVVFNKVDAQQNKLAWTKYISRGDIKDFLEAYKMFRPLELMAIYYLYADFNHVWYKQQRRPDAQSSLYIQALTKK